MQSNKLLSFKAERETVIVIEISAVKGAEVWCLCEQKNTTGICVTAALTLMCLTSFNKKFTSWRDFGDISNLRWQV